MTMAEPAARTPKPDGSAPKAQYAALPYREDDGLQVLLITTRRTRRWIVPKGWPMEGRTPWESAAQEAVEEAGVEGVIAQNPIGSYVYDKRRKDGQVAPCSLEVFPLRVTRHLEDWPEKGEREVRWFPIAEAIENVEEQGLKDILRNFLQSRGHKA